MGRSHHNHNRTTRRCCLPPRRCLRKGCDQQFAPQRWNQRYCQDPVCLQEVRRWLARKRQRQCRQSEEQRRRHCERERARRARLRQANQASQDSPSTPPQPARGHAAEPFFETFCDRPGCYDPTCPSSRVKSRYCGSVCRAVMRQVRDRERKWLLRNTYAGHFKRQLEYQRQRQLRLDRDDATGPLRQ